MKYIKFFESLTGKSKEEILSILSARSNNMKDFYEAHEEFFRDIIEFNKDTNFLRKMRDLISNLPGNYIQYRKLRDNEKEKSIRRDDLQIKSEIKFNGDKSKNTEYSDDVKKFIMKLENQGLWCEVDGDKIIVINKYVSGNVDLKYEKTIPPNVIFNNKGSLNLDSLKTLPLGVEFNNQGSVHLKSLTSIPSSVKFNNKGYHVYLGSITDSEVFAEWKYVIKRINNKTLLNTMIKKGIFSR